MDSNLKWLVIGELIVMSIVFIVWLIYKKLESKKVNNILKFIEKKSNDKDVEDKFQECIEIIKRNNVEVDKDGK